MPMSSGLPTKSSPARWNRIWITGASSGIGRELALQLARRGAIVAASARSADKLAGLAVLEPRIKAYPLDVTDRAAVKVAADRIAAELGPVDLAILNAGVGTFASGAKFDAGLAAETMAVNYLGIANALEALIPAMVARGSGHLAFVASVAGYRGLARAAAYGASKAAVINLAESLAIDLGRHGITVSVVNPGFVDTPMTEANRFAMPFLLQADDAAERIIRGLERRKLEIAFPWQMVAMLKAARLLPAPLYVRLMRLSGGAGRRAQGEAAGGQG